MSMKRMGYNFDDMLCSLGLKRRRSFETLLSAVGLIAVGAAVGAAVGLAFAPSSGDNLRKEMTQRLDQVRQRVKQNAVHLTSPS
jgi:hypothetical protein